MAHYNNMKKNNRGFTLLFSMIAVSLLMGVTLGILNLTTKQLVLSAVGRESQLAFYAADSGAECARYWDINFNAFSPSANTVVTCNGQAVTISTDGNTKQFTYQLVSGDPNGGEATVQVTRNPATGLTRIESYGHNTSVDNPRRVERAVRIDYTTAVDPGGNLTCSPRSQTVTTGSGQATINLTLTPPNSSATYDWSKESGPGTASGSITNSRFTSQFSAAGTYQIRFTSGSYADICTVTVTDGSVPGNSCTPDVDFMLVLDGSGSIKHTTDGEYLWGTVQSAANILIDNLSAIGGMKFGALQFYSTKGVTKYPHKAQMGAIGNGSSVKSQINSWGIEGNYGTDIGTAVLEARDMLMGVRSGREQAIIVISDGIPHYKYKLPPYDEVPFDGPAGTRALSLEKASEVKGQDIKIFTVGVLKCDVNNPPSYCDSDYDKGKAFLRDFSSGATYAYNTNDYSDDDRQTGLLRAVSDLTCPNLDN